MMVHDLCCTSYLWEICCILFSLLIVSNLWLFLRVLRPIHRLSQQADELSRGNFVAIDADCGGIPEIKALRRSMSSMVKHVRRTQTQSIRFADNLADGQEAERLRIARELHDDTIQSLVAISQSIDMAKTWITSMPEQTREMLQLAREQSVETVNNLRRLIEDLRPPALEELGLVPALRMQIERCSVPTEIRIKGTPRRLDESRELALFRIAQEAMTNARRYASASQMFVDLDFQSDHIELAIHDDGRGFDVPEHLPDLADDGHYGLMGIQERIHQLGGKLVVESIPLHGTTLIVHIPARQADQPENEVRDPVCSAIIQPQQAYASLNHEGEEYFFCCPICQGAFQKDPKRYTTSTFMLQSDAIETRHLAHG